ncbi:MAG: flagellar hook-associated protein FlgK [Phycisphaerae bacterium]|nr:flagellar hook-associated protein FlgK [Phycisphaerae bacterium]
MSLTGALHIGRSALIASQIGVQVTGNNIANVSTPGYSRGVARLTGIAGQGDGRLSVGRGVQVSDVQRQIDMALQGRIWAGVSSEAASGQVFSTLSQLETILGELGENDLSSEMSAFFSSWSEAANGRRSPALVIQQGVRLADFVRSRRDDLSRLRSQSDRQLGAAVERADQLLTQVADLNRRIADAEVGGVVAGALRDQRDQLVTELAQFADVSTIERGGQLDVLIGSAPVVLGATSRGLMIRRETVGDETRVLVASRADGQVLDVREGQIGALLSGRDRAIDRTIADLDRLAASLIFEVNRLHSTGANASRLSSASGTLGIPSADRTRAINDPANTAFASLPFRAVNGGFTVDVRDKATGAVTTVRIEVDLDGLNNAQQPGTGDDTTPEQIRAALDAIPGLSATFAPDGSLRVDADSGLDFSFRDDSSGVLAVLGVNAYFTGTSASDMGVRGELKADPGLLMLGRFDGTALIENGTALAIVGLQDRRLASLNDRTIKGAWNDAAQLVGSEAAGARSAALAATVVRESLDAQRAAVSGVNLDEEAINLLSFQRQYQGAARLISTADEMFQTLIGLV